MHTDRQVQILESSMELIADKGIQGFTIKNLSKKIGISEPAVYRHFESKTDILIALLDNFKEMTAILALLSENPNNSASEKIESIFCRLIDVFTEKPETISVIFSEEIFKNDIVLKTKIIELQNLHQSNIERVIEKGQNDNHIKKDIDKETLALILMGSFRHLVKRWHLNNHNFNLRIEGEKLISTFKLIIKK